MIPVLSWSPVRRLGEGLRLLGLLVGISLLVVPAAAATPGHPHLPRESARSKESDYEDCADPAVCHSTRLFAAGASSKARTCGKEEYGRARCGNGRRGI